MTSRTVRLGLAVGVLSLGTTGLARAATLEVGPAKPYSTPCAAVGKAQAGDEIDIAPGTYTDSCEINTPGLTLKGVGGQPKMDVSGTNHPADYKGIYVISADNVTIENLELTGAHVDDSEGGNAAGLRITGHGVVVHGCYIHDNQNGILAAPIVDGGTITIEYTELSHNGLGDACDQGGCVHNVYISKASSTVRYDKTVFQFNWSHDLASDTVNKGHLFKSRSRETDVLYNRITGEAGHDSYEVDIPNGGVGIVVGNVIEKGPSADNSTLLAFGEEGVDNPAESLYVASNTFVNDFTGGTFLGVAAGGTLAAHDNLFAGPGTLSSTGSLSADNLSGVDPLFVDAATYDYHLKAGSPAIGKAVAPGMAGAFSLTASFEYVQPLESVVRATDHDLGAFEYGTSVAGAAMDASTGTGVGSGGEGGAPVTDAGGESDGAPPPATDGGDDAASGSDGDQGFETGGASHESSGCGCKVTGGATGSTGSGVAVLGLAGILAWTRRRRGQ